MLGLTACAIPRQLDDSIPRENCPHESAKGPFSSRPDANTRNPGYSYSGGCQTSEVGDAPNGRSGHSLKWNCLQQSLPVDAVDEIHAHDGAVLRAVEALKVEAVAVDRRKAREEGVDAGDALGRQGAADERGVPVDVP